jgi:hypothetical protein
MFAAARYPDRIAIRVVAAVMVWWLLMVAAITLTLTVPAPISR